MKHDIKVVMFLVGLFLVSQIVGLSIVNRYIDHEATRDTGNVTWSGLPYDIERPDIEEETSYAWIIAAILLGTVLIFVLMRMKTMVLWKAWFFGAVLITLTIAFKPWFGQTIALLLALMFAYFKIFRRNVILSNLGEVFIYGGLAAIFVPIINLKSAFLLLLLISVYDAYAVWKSKHMIKLAKFQSKSKVFAGLMIPYKRKPEAGVKKGAVKGQVEKKVEVAVLGGGDVGFPLIFAGVVMKGLMLNGDVLVSFAKTLIIPIVTAITLFMLLYYARKGKFYPAMPFLSIGCFIGYGIILIV